MIFSSVIYLYRGEDIVTDKMFNDIIDSIINNATDDEIEIIREKLNNHIINHVYDGEVHKELSDEFDSSLPSLWGMITSLNTARIKMEIKDIYANIVIDFLSPHDRNFVFILKKEAYQ